MSIFNILSEEFWTYFFTLDIWQGIIIFLFAILITIVGRNMNFVVVFFRKMGSLFKRKNKLSCGYCALIMLNSVSDSVRKKKEIKDNLLDDQMKYVELKIEVFVSNMLQSYKKDQKQFRKNNENPDYVMEDKEYKLYKEGLKNTIELVIREIRRSFKENGFHQKSGKEFADYVKEKSAELISIAKNYTMLYYPSDNMIVPLSYRFEKLDEKEIEDLTFEVFIKAKEIINNAEIKIKEIENQFQKTMDEIANNK